MAEIRISDLWNFTPSFQRWKWTLYCHEIQMCSLLACLILIPKWEKGWYPLAPTVWWHHYISPIAPRRCLLLAFLFQRPCGHGRGTHCHHVITLHIRLVVIFTFVIELAEEVESHHSIEVDNHSQESNSQNQLGMRKRRCRGVEFNPRRVMGPPVVKGDMM